MTAHYTVQFVLDLLGNFRVLVTVKMKAVRLNKPGPPEDLDFTDTAPLPIRRRGELLVKLHATSVNPIDCKLRLFPGFILNKPKVRTVRVSG